MLITLLIASNKIIRGFFSLVVAPNVVVRHSPVVYFWRRLSRASPLLEIATAYRDGEIQVRKQLVVRGA